MPLKEHTPPAVERQAEVLAHQCLVLESPFLAVTVNEKGTHTVHAVGADDQIAQLAAVAVSALAETLPCRHTACALKMIHDLLNESTTTQTTKKRN